MLEYVCIERYGQKMLLERPHTRLYKYVLINFDQYQKQSVIIDKLRGSSSHLKLDENKQLTWYMYSNLKMNIVLYSALALEAYINYYAIRYEIVFHEELERKLSTPEKWRIYPYLKTGKKIAKSSQDIILNTFKLRNSFVHPKPELVDPSKKVNEKNANSKLDRKNMGYHINELSSVFRALFEIDIDEYSDHEKDPWIVQLKKA